jgi:16S rRNA (cytosine967-C5)-methyltransferase
MRVPDHAAVGATVEVARKRIGESKASFVNALLRNVTRTSIEDWFAPLASISDPVERFSIQYSHPQWIVSAYFDLLKDWEAVESLLSINNVAAKPTLVSWPGRSTQKELVELGGVATEFSSYGAQFDGAPGTLEVIRHRNAGVQDEGSQLVTTVFATAVSGKKNWLDLCAGPGGKAALLSSIATVDGAKFTANEISTPRAQLVKQVVAGARVWVGDGREISTHGETFDAILIDAPCTGLGALRRRPEVRWRRTVQDLRELTQLQRELLEGAYEVLESDGILGYATCSPHLAETQVQVMGLLKAHPDLEQIPVDAFMPKNLEGATRSESMTLWTHIHGTDAMFLALFRKKSEVK